MFPDRVGRVISTAAGTARPTQRLVSAISYPMCKDMIAHVSTLHSFSNVCKQADRPHLVGELVQSLRAVVIECPFKEPCGSTYSCAVIFSFRASEPAPGSRIGPKPEPRSCPTHCPVRPLDPSTYIRWSLLRVPRLRYQRRIRCLHDRVFSPSIVPMLCGPSGAESASPSMRDAVQTPA